MEPIECDLCHGLYCLKCKFESDHKCPKKNIRKSKRSCYFDKKIYIVFILLFLLVIVAILIILIWKHII